MQDSPADLGAPGAVNAPAGRQRLGPVELSAGVTRGNVLVKLLASFVGIGALSGMAILQSYILTAHLHVPRAAQGTLSGNLAFWSEIVGLLLFIPFGIAADRIGRRPVLSFGFVMLALGWGLYPFATSTRWARRPPPAPSPRWSTTTRWRPPAASSSA
jgi:MFS family permease